MPVLLQIIAVLLVSLVGIAGGALFHGLAQSQESRLHVETGSRMRAALARLSGTARDIDSDGTVEAVPSLTPPDPSADAWGNAWRVCAWNHGALNAASASTGHLAGLESGYDGIQAVQLISAGPDGVFQTACGEAAAADDREAGLKQSELAQRSPAFARGDNGGQDLTRAPDAAPGALGIGTEPDAGFRLDVAGPALATGILGAWRLDAFPDATISAAAGTALLYAPLQTAEADSIETGNMEVRYLRIGWTDQPCQPAVDGLLRFAEFGTHGVIEACVGSLPAWRELARIEP